MRFVGRKLERLQNSLREHVNALTVDIGPRTPLDSNSLVRAANYIHSVFEGAGLSVREQAYQYHAQWVTNVIAMHNFTFMAELVKSLELALLALPPAPASS
jgi:hypothetical protein